MGLRRADYQLLAAFRRELRGFLAFSEQVAQATGLPTQQYQALLAIKGQTGRERMTIGDLSRELLIALHSGSELVERLVAKDLLVRTSDPRDRRRVLLSLTPTADRVLAQMARTHLEELRRMQPALLSLLQRFAGPVHEAAGVGATSPELPRPHSRPASRRPGTSAR